ncbi:hypothetical protein UNDKW_5927 (plasmid) [Undibacterium sp. KW1]|uniref:hypothetical protein n=1 Tax=Undibacterium sp. KW1 TaxID=2058624 RepID=UPI001331CC52|nr:hypothetical protein [Undibacterium sp. KW1]BBB64200.1 hypothetical protein UNDKW_5927 [Undibacterium sp. KW1]
MNTATAASFDEILQEALRLSQANDGPTAIKLFQEALAINPQSAATYCLLAAEYITLGQVAESEAAYANALMLAPEFHLARFQMGLLQFTSARVPVALLTWQPLLALSDENALKLFVMGFAHIARDDFEVAINYFERGIKVNADIPPLNTDIQRVIAEIKGLQDKSALTAADQANATSTIAPTADGSNEDEDANVHFLLSNYQQHEPLH